MTTTIQRSFAGGEISPSLQARIDISKYQSGLSACRNFFVMRHGGARNRAGSEFAEEVKDSTKKVRLIEFIFNNEDSLVLEFGENYIRFIKDGAYIKVGVAIYELATTYTEAEIAELNYVQIGDVVTIAHQNHPPADLKRLADNNWTLTDITFAPETTKPTFDSVSGGTPSPGDTIRYAITAVDGDFGEESLPNFSVTADTLVNAANPMTITINLVPGVDNYVIYKSKNGIDGFIGFFTGNTFVDNGVEPDLTENPPRARNPFDSVGNYPATVTYFQQRRVFANTINEPEKIWASKVGAFSNFSAGFPIREDDSITFTVAGRQVNEVKHLIDLNSLVIFTQGSEWSAAAPEAGPFTTTNINAQQHSYNGSSDLEPLLVNGTALYVQNRGTVIRDLRYSVEVNGYRGNDLSIYASHLFDENTIVDWAYQQIPHSNIWVVRDDGTLLGLTYVIEQNMLAWHRHDFDGGFVESVTTIPENNEDVIYVVVRRTINGVTKRYIERIADRTPKDVRDHHILDSHISYDGRNTNILHTMTINESTGWEQSESLSVVSSTAFFSAADVGNEIQFTDSDGMALRIRITAFTSTTAIIGRAHKDVPISLQAVAVSNWVKAVDMLSGLDHLEGKDVSIYADGFVVASPNNESYVKKTVVGGEITLDDPYGVIYVGLPITADLETLNIDTLNSETLSDKKMLINQVHVSVEESRGLWAGVREPTGDDPLECLDELKIREDENYDDPVDLETGVVKVNISGEYNNNGRVFIRQVDPVPLTVLAIAPAGLIPFRKGS